MSAINSYDDLSLHEDPRCKPPHCESKIEQNIKLYWRRWFILYSFALIVILNAFNLNEYFDVEETFIQFYKTSFPNGYLDNFEAIYWLTIINLICYITFVFPSMFLLEAKGIGFSCMLGIFLTIFGSWIKCASVKLDLFAVLIMGQIICAIAQPFIQSPLVKLSSLWFGQNETATATSVGLILNYLLIYKGARIKANVPISVIFEKKSSIY